MKLGKTFSRAEIQEMLGGGTRVFAPHKNGRVTCLCLDLKQNPDAPRIALPAGGKRRDKMVRMVTELEAPVPVFLKKGNKAWEYVGHFEFDSISRKRKDIERQHNGSVTPLDEIQAVIHLRKKDQIG